MPKSFGPPRSLAAPAAITLLQYRRISWGCSTTGLGSRSTGQGLASVCETRSHTRSALLEPPGEKGYQYHAPGAAVDAAAALSAARTDRQRRVGLVDCDCKHWALGGQYVALDDGRDALEAEQCASSAGTFAQKQFGGGERPQTRVRHHRSRSGPAPRRALPARRSLLPLPRQTRWREGSRGGPSRL